MTITAYTDKVLLKKLIEIEDQIGNTPLIDVSVFSSNPNVKIFAKAEWKQLGGSVKARPAYNIIKQAVIEGDLHSEKTLIDASSGNTGIAYASIAQKVGFKATIVLPENASLKRKKILKELGAKIIYTSPFESTDGAQDKALELFESNPDKYFYADQYNNDNNWKAHFFTTGPEIIQQTNEEITHFVAGLGTTGTYTGVSEYLKLLHPKVHITGLQPETALHGLEGWKHLETAIIPGIYKADLANQFLNIKTEEAYDFIIKTKKKANLSLSPSSAANLVGAVKVSQQIQKGTIVTVFPDNSDKYQEVNQQLFN